MQSTVRAKTPEANPPKCADIVRAYEGREPPESAMHGCAFGAGEGSYIFGGDGDDKVYIGHDAGKTYVSGGRGDDTVHVARDTSLGVAASVITNPVGAIAVGALVLAAILIWVLSRFATRSGARGGR